MCLDILSTDLYTTTHILCSHLYWIKFQTSFYRNKNTFTTLLMVTQYHILWKYHSLFNLSANLLALFFNINNSAHPLILGVKYLFIFFVSLH